MSFPAQAQTTNICDRTQQVQDWILFITSTFSGGDTCDRVLVSAMDHFTGLSLPRLRITSLRLGDFAGLPNVTDIDLRSNQLDELPAGIFSGLSRLIELQLEDNPGAPFQFTVRFKSSELRNNFTTASVRAVLREGAPRPIAVPLSVTGATLSASTLNFTTGGVRSDAVTVTRTPGGEPFELSQGELELGGDDDRYSGFEIVPGPSVDETTFTHLKVKVFLEGALE